jgi:16S rRNA (adenine1518-N6/adenine1519-N6)-dimethyltransferase
VDRAASPSSGPRRTLTPSSLRSLAERHGIRPRKALGQHFLIDANLARRIAQLAEVGPGDRVVEVGPGLGSLTLALAETGAEVLAVEIDPRLIPPLTEMVGDRTRVRVVVEDAVRADWSALLRGGPWAMVANLPYNVAVPVVMRVLDEEPRVRRLLVMVQREVGERLAAGPGDPQYGAVSVRVAYRADARVVRPVSRSVFWPRPNVDSVLVLLERRPPPVRVDEDALRTVVRESFAQRRKTMRSALVRLGLARERANELLARCDVRPEARPEELALEDFACLANGVARADGA